MFTSSRRYSTLSQQVAQFISNDIKRGVWRGYLPPERYLAGNIDLLQNPSFLPSAPGPLVGVDEHAQVDPSAHVRFPSRIAAGAVIEPGAVVGPEAVVCGGGRVAAGAEISRCVVLPGATASGKQSGVVIMPNIAVPAEA